MFASEQYILMCGMFIVHPWLLSLYSLSHRINLSQKPINHIIKHDCLFAMALQQNCSTVKEKIDFVLDVKFFYQ